MSIAEKQDRLVDHLRQQGVGCDADPRELVNAVSHVFGLHEGDWWFAGEQMVATWAYAFAFRCRAHGIAA
jgi:hypothetical protein